MSLLIALNYPGDDTFVTRDVRVTGSALNSDTRDLRVRGQTSIADSRELRITGQIGPITYIGSLGSATASGSATSLTLAAPFVTAGMHVILLITHSSGGNVVGASDPRGNIWTLDKASTFNGGIGIAIVSAHIDNSILSGDLITVTWSAAVTQRGIQGEIYRGIRETSYVDQTASNSATSIAVDTGLTALTTSENELVLGAVAIASGAYNVDFVSDAGYIDLNETDTQFGNSANVTITGGFKVVNISGTYKVTGTLN